MDKNITVSTQGINKFFLTVKTGSGLWSCDRWISFSSFISRRVRTAAALSLTSLAPPAFFLANVEAAGLAGKLAAVSAGLTPSLKFFKLIYILFVGWLLCSKILDK